MKKWLIVVMGLLSFTVRAGELEEAKQWISDMRSRITFIRNTGLHQQDEGRLLILDMSVAKVQKALEDNGLLSVKTFNLYKQMIIKFRYSSQYFEFIRTVRTEVPIRELLEIVAKTIQKLELGEDPYGTILKTNLSQMQEAMEALSRVSDVSEDLKAWLKKFRVVMGEAISKAEQGDRPIAFKAAVGVYWAVRALYPELQAISSKPGYAMALEIMGLNEFIGEYAQEEKP